MLDKLLHSGKSWNTSNVDYQAMHDRKPLLNQHFSEYIANINPDMILDIGCGIGIYSKYTSSKSYYLGIDINQQAINVAKKTYPQLDFMVYDFMIYKTIYGFKFDLIFAHDVIDHIKDIDKFIEKALSIANHVYISSYRGFYNNTDKHIISYNKHDGFYYNYVSHIRLKKLFPQITIHKVESGYKQDSSFGRDSLDGYSMVIIK